MTPLQKAQQIEFEKVQKEMMKRFINASCFPNFTIRNVKTLKQINRRLIIQMKCISIYLVNTFFAGFYLKNMVTHYNKKRTNP
jgi:hypothetical protein